MQDPSIYGAGPHETRMAECSIGDGDRHSTDNIIEDVMVGHLADGISARVGAIANGENHFLAIEFAGRLGFELRGVDGMEHPFEVVEARHHGSDGDEDHYDR